MENTGEEANADSDLIEFIGTKGYEKIIVTDDYDQTDDAEIVSKENNEDPLPIEYKLEISEMESASVMP